MSDLMREVRLAFLMLKLHCTRVHAGGDDFMSWLALSEDGKFRFPRAVRVFNLDIWMASLRSYQFVCRTLQTVHAKKEILVMKSSGSVNSKKVS